MNFREYRKTLTLFELFYKLLQNSIHSSGENARKNSLFVLVRNGLISEVYNTLYPENPALSLSYWIER